MKMRTAKKCIYFNISLRYGKPRNTLMKFKLTEKFETSSFCVCKNKLRLRTQLHLSVIQRSFFL